jgi:hypothetical protein
VKRGEHPPKIWRLDLRTGTIEIWREIQLTDPAGLMPKMRIRITPDGKSVAYSAYRLLSELYLAEGLK